MPMIDAFIPENALSTEAEKSLLHRLVDVVLEHERLDPASAINRAVTWVYVHRTQLFISADTGEKAHFRFIISVPEGQFDAAAREGVTSAITELVAAAEGAPVDQVAPRVFVIANDIPEGTWGAFGHILGVERIVSGVAGGEAGAQAAKRLNDKRRGEARSVLSYAAEHV